ncbi:hypothetical protein ACIQCR_21065 [Streptomyces sp. NPDC093249]|uniref:hypothetical protein n=1 Tax=unclassified Streptomyces TaxID=2593676 RepID=UPI00380CA935
MFAFGGGGSFEEEIEGLLRAERTVGGADHRAQLTKDLASFKPDVVAHQITTYDWGTVTEQRAA